MSRVRCPVATAIRAQTINDWPTTLKASVRELQAFFNQEVDVEVALVATT